jgi:hypothetical protein
MQANRKDATNIQKGPEWRKELGISFMAGIVAVCTVTTRKIKS